MIHIVVHQFVHKTSAKKKSYVWKIGPPLSPGTRKYVESVLRIKKSIPYKPYISKKHIESILGTFLTHENNNIQFEYYNLWQFMFSQPLLGG